MQQVLGSSFIIVSGLLMVVLGVYALSPTLFGWRRRIGSRVGSVPVPLGTAAGDPAVDQMLAELIELRSRVAGLEEELQAVRSRLDASSADPSLLPRAA